MRKLLIAIALASLPTLAFAAPFHSHTNSGVVRSAPAFHSNHVAHFNHGFRHFRHARNFGFFAAAPYIAGDDYCWRLVRTPYGLHRVWVCQDYGYDY